MKKIHYLSAALMLALGMSGCSSAASVPSEEAAVSSVSEAEESEAPEVNPAAEEEETETEKGILVVYFSATGTTKGIAEKIASVTGGNLYEITAAEEYTEADLNYNDSNSRTTHEQDDPSVRPEISSETISLDGYSTVYIGYPIWWGEEPRIMDTFVESCSFDGITMIPFCTSGSSGIGRSGKNLADNAGSGNWLEGRRFDGGASEEEISSWISEIQ